MARRSRKRNRSNDPLSVEWMYDRLQVSVGAQQQSHYARMMGSILYRLALNRIEWEGLPEGYSGRLIERLLIKGESLALYKDPNDYADQPIFYRAIPADSLNGYLLPSHYTLTSLNGMKTVGRVSIDDLALLDPNHERMQVEAIIASHVDLFTQYDMTLRSNLTIQKTPVMVIATEEAQLSAATLMDQYKAGDPELYTVSGPAQSLRDMVQALTFDVQYIGDRLLIDRRQAWNDCMTYLGIDNSNQDKRERLVRAEISGNDDQISNARMVELNPRKEFAEYANERFDMDITVSWNDDVIAEEFAGTDPEHVEALGRERALGDRINPTIED